MGVAAVMAAAFGLEVEEAMQVFECASDHLVYALQTAGWITQPNVCRVAQVGFGHCLEI